MRSGVWKRRDGHITSPERYGRRWMERALVTTELRRMKRRRRRFGRIYWGARSESRPNLSLFYFPFCYHNIDFFLDVVGGPTRHRDTTSAALLVSGTDMTNGCWQCCSLRFSFTHWWFCILAFQPLCILLFIAMQMCTRERIDLFNMFKLRKDWSFAVKRSTNSWKGKFSKLYIF